MAWSSHDRRDLIDEGGGDEKVDACHAKGYYLSSLIHRQRDAANMGLHEVALREKFMGKGLESFRRIEGLCNRQYAENRRLHAFAQSAASSQCYGDGDCIECIHGFREMN